MIDDHFGNMQSISFLVKELSYVYFDDLPSVCVWPLEWLDDEPKNL